MKEITYTTQNAESRVLVGGSFDKLNHYAPLGKCFLLSDHTVHSLYGEHFPDRPCFLLPAGEHNKTLTVVSRIYDWLIDNGVDRSHFIVAIGGGIVCDVAGFTASTYMRGLPFGFVSTTLLSQVDASVGGKNGVNYSGYKNMVGTFNQPDFVLCDTSLLKSLPDFEYVNGLAEIVKHALITDVPMYEKIQETVQEINNRDESILQYLIRRSVEIKSAIVTEDEREKGRRRLLNFGHTLAHALEKTTTISHGMAVGQGMIFALRISVMRGVLSQEDADAVESLLKKLGIETKIEVDIVQLKDAFRKDKKKSGSHIHFILLHGIGNAVSEMISYEELEEYIDALCRYC